MDENINQGLYVATDRQTRFPYFKKSDRDIISVDCS